MDVQINVNLLCDGCLASPDRVAYWSDLDTALCLDCLQKAATLIRDDR